MPFTLEQILNSAASHPFYSNYLSSFVGDLSDFPLLDKPTLHESLHSAIVSDPSFLQSVYISPTGGSSGAGKSLFFVTDAGENRRQREKAGQLIGRLRAIEKHDIVLNLHGGNALYRSLDLMGDLIEYAGSTNIPAGSDFSDKGLVPLALLFHTNVITGTSSRLLIFARYLLSNPDANITFSKVIYTSEPLPVYQEVYLRKAFRCEVVASLYGSAECGIWGVSVPSSDFHGSKPYRDFVFETETMIVEVIGDDGSPMQEGEVGEIVVTSLMRFRNPLVRFRTGDIGSLHPFTADGDGKNRYQCVRLYGRHPGKSFHLNGEKFDVVEIEKVMGDERWGVLEWQVILESDHTGEREESVEFRIVLKGPITGDDCLGDLRTKLLGIVGYCAHITADVSLKVVEYAGLEKGTMANKIRRIVDRR